MQPHFIEGFIEVGVDEVGRGCLAGPVVAAAVVWPQEESLDHSMIKDSKKMTAAAREKALDYIKENAIEWSVKHVDNAVIDAKNILQATYDAMHGALDDISTPFELILVDGDKFRSYKDISHECIVKGDSAYVSIAAASIIAKQVCDKYMFEQALKYPGYGWETNVGYGTKVHMDAIRQHGVTSLHRKTFLKTFDFS